MRTMLAIGGVKFEVGKTGFDDLSRKVNLGWKEQETLSGVKYHNTGRKGIEVNLKGVRYPRKDPANVVRRLEDAAGEPQTVIDESGNILGRWIVTDISEKMSEFIGSSPQKIEYDITMKRYE